jgi:methyl-accepting chemotaxis protein
MTRGEQNMKSTWTIGRRLIASFIALAGITLTLGIVGYYGAVQSGKSIEDIGGTRLPAVENVLTYKDALSILAGAQQALLNQDLNTAGRKQQLDIIAAMRERYTAARERYEALPHSDEEKALWDKTVAAIGALRDANNEFFKTCEELDQLHIENSYKLRATLEKVRGDHFQLRTRVLGMMQSKQLFDGGDDPHKCALGQWMATYNPANPELRAAMQAIVTPHNALHASVGKLKELVGKDDTPASLALYQTEMAPAVDQVSGQIDTMVQATVKTEDIATKAAQIAIEKVMPAKAESDRLLGQVVDLNKRNAVEQATAAARQASIMKTMSLSAMIGGVLLAFVLGLTITRSINRVLTRIASALDDGAEQVNAAAGQVASASQQLAEGASEQASSLEETSSALEEMAAMTRTNAGNAKEANELAAQARTAADTGDKTMVQLNTAMSAINESSEKISKIIKVIEEIAFQTNLLALNAAVEAARAGEHGKGFAVVADEVRNLAQRAAGAARETTDLIEGSVNNVRAGTSVAGDVGKALGAIVSDVSRVSDLIQGISKASDEQAQGVEQVNTAVGQMDKVTQQNASAAEESASAAEELAAQAQAVKSMVQELVALVGGAAARDGTSGPDAGDPAAPQHDPRSRTHKPRRVPKPKTVAAAATNAGHPTAEFLPLEGEQLNDF